MITTTSTPQPFRTQQNPIRNAFEAEIWDDNSDVIYAAYAVTLTFPVRVTARAWIEAMATVILGGVLTLSMDGTPLPSASTVGAATTGTILAFIDLSPGNHTVTLTATAAITDPLIMVRRGRIPPTV